jgi:hypothetical protein
MVGGDAIAEVIAERFRIDCPLTLLARRSSKARIGFSRMRNSHAVRGRSLAVPQEEAFSFHVPLSLPFFSNLWTGGRRREVPDWCLGDAQLVDLRDNPVVSLDTSFDSLRFYIPQIALDEMANEAGIRRVKGLYAPTFGFRESGHVRPSTSARRRDGAARRRQRHVFRLYCACFFFSHCARLRQRLSRWKGRPRRTRTVAAAARPRLHHRQPGGGSFNLPGRG